MFSTLHVNFAYCRTLRNQQQWWEFSIHVMVFKTPLMDCFWLLRFSTGLRRFACLDFHGLFSLFHGKTAVWSRVLMDLMDWQRWAFSAFELLYATWTLYFIKVTLAILFDRPLEIPDHGDRLILIPLAQRSAGFRLMSIIIVNFCAGRKPYASSVTKIVHNIDRSTRSIRRCSISFHELYLFL